MEFMKTKLSKQMINVIDQNSGMSRYLESLLVGKKATPRSWLYEKVSPDSILDNWKSILSSLQDGSKYEQEVFQFDLQQEEKWGPQGAVPPIEEIMDIVEQGYHSSGRPSAFDTREWAKAKELTWNDFKAAGLVSLRPASYSAVLDDMRARDVLESNSGWPLFTRRTKPEVKQQALAAAKDGQWKTYPAIALFRNYNQKTRLVWMYPLAVNLVEGSFFQVLQSKIMRSKLADSFFAPWKGFDAVRDLITTEFESRHYLAASDFSSTDAHFQLSASLEVCDIIERCFQAQYRPLLRESITYMHNIPLIIGPNSQLVGSHGVSSGSNWTNFIETVFDRVFAYYTALQPKISYRGLYAIGDDMTWVSNSYSDAFASDLEHFGKQVGQEVRADKTTNFQDKVKTLQRLFQRGYSRPDGKLRGVYPTIRALKSSVFPERFHKPKSWSSDMFCARQYMILENCVDHPLFEEFVKFVVQGQKDLIPFARKSSRSLERIHRKSKLLPGLNPTYNQERRDQSLAEFASIRFARTL